VSTHPGKANLTIIAKAMVAKYDKALADFIQDCGMVAWRSNNPHQSFGMAV